MKIDDYEIENVNEISTIIQNIGCEEVSLTFERDGEILKTCVTPVKCFDDGEYKLGLWVRDGAMGVGTLTFYLPQHSKYAALGHGISDEDSKDLIEVGNGEIYDADLLSITKGKTDMPGEIKGFLNDSNKIGEIDVNSNNGIYGSYNNENANADMRKSIPIASRNEIELGPAKILCTVDETQEIKEYDIEILKISSSNLSSSKGMVIRVTDEDLIEKTGGIIQGMSGSPIVQNGKLIGAVTHVYVNDPTKGYAILAETMIQEATCLIDYKEVS